MPREVGAGPVEEGDDGVALRVVAVVVDVVRGGHRGDAIEGAAQDDNARAAGRAGAAAAAVVAEDGHDGVVAAVRREVAVLEKGRGAVEEDGGHARAEPVGEEEGLLGHSGLRDAGAVLRDVVGPRRDARAVRERGGERRGAQPQQRVRHGQRARRRGGGARRHKAAPLGAEVVGADKGGEGRGIRHVHGDVASAPEVGPPGLVRRARGRGAAAGRHKRGEFREPLVRRVGLHSQRRRAQLEGRGRRCARERGRPGAHECGPATAVEREAELIVAPEVRRCFNEAADALLDERFVHGEPVRVGVAVEDDDGTGLEGAERGQAAHGGEAARRARCSARVAHDVGRRLRRRRAQAHGRRQRVDEDVGLRGNGVARRKGGRIVPDAGRPHARDRCRERKEARGVARRGLDVQRVVGGRIHPNAQPNRVVGEGRSAEEEQQARGRNVVRRVEVGTARRRRERDVDLRDLEELRPRAHGALVAYVEADAAAARVRPRERRQRAVAEGHGVRVNLAAAARDAVCWRGRGPLNVEGCGRRRGGARARRGGERRKERRAA